MSWQTESIQGVDIFINENRNVSIEQKGESGMDNQTIEIHAEQVELVANYLMQAHEELRKG